MWLPLLQEAMKAYMANPAGVKPAFNTRGLGADLNREPGCSAGSDGAGGSGAGGGGAGGGGAGGGDAESGSAESGSAGGGAGGGDGVGSFSWSSGGGGGSNGGGSVGTGAPGPQQQRAQQHGQASPGRPGPGGLSNELQAQLAVAEPLAVEASRKRWRLQQEVRQLREQIEQQKAAMSAEAAELEAKEIVSTFERIDLDGSGTIDR